MNKKNNNHNENSIESNTKKSTFQYTLTQYVQEGNDEHECMIQFLIIFMKSIKFIDIISSY